MSKQILVIAAPNLVLLGSQVPGNQPGKRASWLRVGLLENVRIWPETAGNSRKRSDTARKEMGMPELVVHDPDEAVPVLGRDDAVRPAQGARAAHEEVAGRPAAEEALRLALAEL